MRKFRFMPTLAAFVLLALVSCTKPTRHIVIITTNDIHAAIDNFPKLAGLVEEYRSTDSLEVLLVDAGDRWTGNPYVDRADDIGKPIIDLMNDLAFDLATLGNHEFDYGLDLLAERIGQSAFQNVMANADVTGTPLPPIAPYTFREAGGVRIGFMGLITTAVNGHPAGKDENFAGIDFYDPVETAVKYRNLKDSVDLFVVISHAGLDVDTLIAAAVPEIDLIIGGHSHDALDEGGIKIGNVLITQTGSRLKNVGITTITVRGNKITGIENRLIPLADVSSSAAYEQKVADIKVNPEMMRTVGAASADMGKIALMNFFSDIMRMGTDSQFGLFNMGSMRIDELPAGDITVGNIYAAEPFNNSPVIRYMTLEELKDMIVLKFNSTGGESHNLDIYPSGFEYTILTDERGEATDVIFRHNYYPERGKRYKVAMSDYVEAQYIFPRYGTAEYTGLMITDLAFDYLRTNSPVKADNNLRVEIIPKF